MATDMHKLQQVLAAAKAHKLLPADAVLPEDERPSWVLLVLSFFGAQLAVWPFLLFLGLTLHELLEEPLGALVVGVVFLAVGVALLRKQDKSMFLSQLAFMTLLVGLGLWCWALHLFGLNNHLFLLALAASLLVLTVLIRVSWVQALLGVLFALAFAHIDWLDRLRVDAPVSGIGWSGALFITNLWLLTGVWWLWCARESRWVHAVWQLSAHGFMNGVAIGILLAVCKDLGHFVWLRAALGSADVDGSGTRSLFQFNVWTVCSCLLVLASGLWLLRRWLWQPIPRRAHVQHGRAAAHDEALWLLLYGAWAVLAFVVPNMGILAVLFTVAWGTGRRRMVGLALLVLLAQLSSFYYALQWPLVHKAVLLLAVGAVLALALVAVHLWARHAEALHAGGAGNQGDARMARTMQRTLWFQRAGLAVVAVLAVALTQRDVLHKEQVLQQGQKIYMPLVPRDPRSIMQGDYMALNFDLPSQVTVGLADVANAAHRSALDPLPSTVPVVARLDAKGIATIVRRHHREETLAPGEVLVPIKYMKGEWVVVTNAYFFPEGHGKSFGRARYGEFRVLGHGKVLLAGLADEKLQRIEPQPDAKESLDAENNVPELSGE